MKTRGTPEGGGGERNETTHKESNLFISEMRGSWSKCQSHKTQVKWKSHELVEKPKTASDISL